jgi:hypothetical protein
MPPDSVKRSSPSPDTPPHRSPRRSCPDPRCCRS